MTSRAILMDHETTTEIEITTGGEITMWNVYAAPHHPSVATSATKIWLRGFQNNFARGIASERWSDPPVTAGTRRRRYGNTIQTDKADEGVLGDLPCCGIRRSF